jgi:hypothetical protein
VSISLVCFGIANVGMNIGILSQVGSINRVEQSIATAVLGHLPHEILTVPNSGAEVKTTTSTGTTQCTFRFPLSTASIVSFDGEAYTKNVKTNTPSTSGSTVAREYSIKTPTVPLVKAMLVPGGVEHNSGIRLLVDHRASATPIAVTSVTSATVAAGAHMEITYTVTGGATLCMSHAAASSLNSVYTNPSVPISFILTK